MGAMSVSEHDVLELPNGMSKLPDCREDPMAIDIEQRVDQDKIVPVLHKKGVHVPSLPLPYRENAFRKLHDVPSWHKRQSGSS